jgi:hypothetical protein
MSNADTAVRAMLAEAGLRPDEGEIQALVAAYPAFKEGIESLYAVEEARYESPALRFDPNPTFADWG